MSEEAEFKVGDIVTVPFAHTRAKAVVLEAPTTMTRWPFDRYENRPQQVRAVHLRLLDGMHHGEPVTFQTRHVRHTNT